MRVFENANTKQKKRTVKNRKISNGVYWMGAVDWNRRLFDSLIPLPDGTSYNAYLVQGTEKTVLIDSVDPEMTDVLERQLDEVEKIDFVVAQHAEQDHSGAISFVLEKYENAIVLCSLKAKDLLMTHLDVPANRIRTVEDGETLQLGEKQLQFIYTPWVHWPDTMVTYLPQERILFTCDFFSSHFATSDLYAENNPAVIQAAKRYYAEIMMPFRSIVKKNIDKIRGFDIAFIAPSHGPIFDHPEQIVSAYESWVSEHVSNVVVLPYISM
ncbi:MAG: FprA family A-type flavoprotein, partial [Chlorobiales bacterium]|nr:FprA family A-type flavoprotein [Chlorobiales bacterium]